MGLQPTNQSDADHGIIEPLCAVFRRSLKDEGLKYTPERAQILDTIIAFDGLFEADQLLEELKGKGFRVSKATVYRTLKLLEDAGIIQRVLFDREQSHYQLAYGRTGNTLLIRVDTGEVETLELPELVVLRDKICKMRGLKAEGHRLQIFATKV
ncbi:MAG: transcriptional repressor [Planctomycetota bacterium]|nr:MAG: transcriptional repressor [Planctomycetota bacterium]